MIPVLLKNKSFVGIMECEEWCRKNLGNNGTWVGMTVATDDIGRFQLTHGYRACILFEYEADAIIFKVTFGL